MGVVGSFSIARVGAQDAAITIDGAFSDWTGLEPATKGLLAESAGDAGSGGNDLRTIWIASDNDHFYLSIRCAGPIKGSTWGPTLVVIDSDLNEATGFPAKPLGADYLIQPTSSLDGKIMVHRRIDGRNDGAWSQWHPPILVQDAYAVGRGADDNRAEMRVPWKAIDVTDPTSAALRLRICDGSPMLNPAEGDWAPDCRLAYFSIGKDPLTMSSAKNLCTNGDFEFLQEAAARPLPQAWSGFTQGPSARIDMSDDAFQGKHALRLAACGGDVAGMNGPVMAVGHGVVRFRYKVLASSVGGQNLALYAIGLSGEKGSEVRRQSCTPPKEHVADKRWHEAHFEFDFSAQQIAHCLVAPRINEGTSKTGDGEWLIDAVEVYRVETGGRIKLAHVWADKPLARTGDIVRFSGWVENTGDRSVNDVSLRLEASEAVRVEEPTKRFPALAPGSYERIDWRLTALKPGKVSVHVVAGVDGAGRKAASAGADKASYSILVVDRSDRYTRQELCTDENGYWRLLERPTTLQKGIDKPLAPVRHKRSAEIKHSPYGICAHLPRSKDYEDPFNPSHLIDDDPETCWSS